MKKIFLLVVGVMLITHSALAQEKRTYRDIAFDYLMQNVESISARPWKVKSDSHNKMSNGNHVIVMTIARTLTLQEEKWVPNQVQAYGATFNVGVRRGNTYSDYEDTESYIVFVDRNGEPTGFTAAPPKAEFHDWNGCAWFLGGNFKNERGGKTLYCFGEINCYKANGETQWKCSDMYIYDWGYTGNNLYLVGTDGPKRSVVRILNPKTFEYKDKFDVCKGIPCQVNFESDGIRISECDENGQFSAFIFPYAATDKKFQRDLVLKSYDLTKATDQISLGERYLNGNVVEKDVKKAVELFEKAANQNSDIGMLKLATCYKNGIGVEQDNARALSLFEKSANKGNTDAMIAVSDMYAEGVGVSKDESKALYWKEKLGFMGNIDAQKYVLSHNTIEFTHTNTNFIEALELARKNVKSANYLWAKYCYERAVSLGSKDAAFELGKWLYEGNGIDRDAPIAAELLGGCGEAGNVEAQKLLASMYRENKGIAPDIKQEMYWIQKAAENGDPDSQYRLGTAYLNGTGVSKDKKLSAEWYEKAAMQNNQEATRLTIINYMSGNGVKKNMETATYFLTHLDNQSQLEFADNVFNGIGMKKNQKLAVSMYEKMATNGNMKAAKKLALCYLEGEGVSKNIETAYQLAMKVRNATHDGQDGDIYYIEAKYLDNKSSSPSGRVADAYRNAIKLGCQKAVNEFARYQRKYRLRLSLNGSSY